MGEPYVFVIADLIDSSNMVWDSSVLLEIANEMTNHYKPDSNHFETSVSQGDTIQLLYSGRLGLYPAVLLYLKLRQVLPGGGRMAIGIGDQIGSLEVPLSIRQGRLLSETGHSLQSLKMARGKMIISDTTSRKENTSALWTALAGLLSKKLDELTMTQVKVLLLKLWNDEMTQDELANTLEMNQSVVSRHLGAAWHQQVRSAIGASQAYILSLSKVNHV